MPCTYFSDGVPLYKHYNISSLHFFPLQVSQVSLQLAQRKNKDKVDGQDFGHKRIERLGEELERLLVRQGYDTAATAPDKKKNAKTEKKRRKSDSDELAPYKKLEAMLDVYFQYSNDKLIETKKVSKCKRKGK